MPIFEIINSTLDILFPVIFGLVLFFLVIIYTIKSIQKSGLWTGIYLGFFALVEAGVAYVALYFFPRWLAHRINHPEYETIFRWITLYITILPLWWLLTKKHNGFRGLIFSFIVLTVFLIGWWFNHWIGILLLSIPALVIFTLQLDRLAQVILPPSIPNPTPLPIRWQKTIAFIKYMAGIQYPVWMAKSKADRELEMLIPGSPFNSIGEPGIIGTWSHQVAAITTGTNFGGAVGPGTTFTRRLQRPIVLVDKRTQLRVTTTKTVTKDGIKVTAVVFMAFKVHRVSMALSRMGIEKVIKEKIYSNLVFYWDEWVVKQVEDAARQIVAERKLDRLWRPEKPGDSALDEMATAMKALLSPKMFNAGIEIFTARIVNFELKEKVENDKKDKGHEEDKKDEGIEDDEKVIEQYLETWRTNWEQKIIKAEAEVTAIYRQELEQAHAYAKSALLETIAESLENARQINDKLPRHVIAQYYIHALDEYIKKQPGLNTEEINERVKNLQQVLLFSREGND